MNETKAVSNHPKNPSRSGNIILLLDPLQHCPLFGSYGGAVERPPQHLVVCVDRFSYGHLDDSKFRYYVGAKTISSSGELQDSRVLSDLLAL
jgi:hypothetical protein